MRFMLFFSLVSQGQAPAVLKILGFEQAFPQREGRHRHWGATVQDGTVVLLQPGQRRGHLIPAPREPLNLTLQVVMAKRDDEADRARVADGVGAAQCDTVNQRAMALRGRGLPAW